MSALNRLLNEWTEPATKLPVATFKHLVTGNGPKAPDLCANLHVLASACCDTDSTEK